MCLHHEGILLHVQFQYCRCMCLEGRECVHGGSCAGKLSKGLSSLNGVFQSFELLTSILVMSGQGPDGPRGPTGVPNGIARS
jgi:hypothetical protein